MSLTREEIERVSLLARLELSDAELAQMTQQLGQILDYVDQLSELDTDAVEPMAHAVRLTNVFAPDEIRPSLPRDEALANAPKRDEECYRVPAVLGD
jgi:aspartyl-tRNA(Asn)/glutamyl-tRNA(Gln) amidotransferase subunit C